MNVHARARVCVCAHACVLQNARASGDDSESRLALASYLVCSRDAHAIQEGVQLLTTLQNAGQHVSDATWWLAVAAYRQGAYKRARMLASELALSEPANRYAEGLLGLLYETYQAEGRTGLAYMAAAVVGVAALGVLIYSIWSRRRASKSDAAAATGALAAAAAGVASASSSRGSSYAPPALLMSTGSSTATNLSTQSATTASSVLAGTAAALYTVATDAYPADAVAAVSKAAADAASRAGAAGAQALRSVASAGSNTAAAAVVPGSSSSSSGSMPTMPSVPWQHRLALSRANAGGGSGTSAGVTAAGASA